MTTLVVILTCLIFTPWEFFQALFHAAAYKHDIHFYLLNFRMTIDCDICGKVFVDENNDDGFDDDDDCGNET
jgi:hypothetical protein